jgi:hypothetical protein
MLIHDSVLTSMASMGYYGLVTLSARYTSSVSHIMLIKWVDDWPTELKNQQLFFKPLRQLSVVVSRPQAERLLEPWTI